MGTHAHKSDYRIGLVGPVENQNVNVTLGQVEIDMPVTDSTQSIEHIDVKIILKRCR